MLCLIYTHVSQSYHVNEITFFLTKRKLSPERRAVGIFQQRKRYVGLENYFMTASRNAEILFREYCSENKLLESEIQMWLSGKYELSLLHTSKSFQNDEYHVLWSSVHVSVKTAG